MSLCLLLDSVNSFKVTSFQAMIKIIKFITSFTNSILAGKYALAGQSSTRNPWMDGSTMLNVHLYAHIIGLPSEAVSFFQPQG